MSLDQRKFREQIEAEIARTMPERETTPPPRAKRAANGDRREEPPLVNRPEDYGATGGAEEQHGKNKKAENEPRADEADAEITRLAKLSVRVYERERKAAAEKLGMRASMLDKIVQAERKKEDDQDDLPHWNVKPWPEPVDGAALLDSIGRVFRRYIVLPKGADIALALWVLHTWTMDAGEISPFVVLVSPTKRCGKTNTLILLFFLTPKSELAANITASSLFRYIEAVRPTLLIDEADTFVKDNEELRGVLNSGHTRLAANVIRNVEVNGEHKPRRFSTWAPKAIATIRELADTLEDRAVTIVLQRKPPGAKVERLRRHDTEELQRVRSQAARWAADNFDKLVDPDPQVPQALNDRAADNWRLLLAIADLAGGTWPEDARRAACTLSGEEQDGAVNVELLRDIRTALGDASEIRTADLLTKLTADPERPWADWSHGKALTAKHLGRLLKPFAIISVNVKPPGLPQGKGYRRVDFKEAWDAYCPGQNTRRDDFCVGIRPSVHRPVESAQVDDFASVHEGSVDGSKNGKLSYSHAGLDAWTLSNEKNSAEHGSDQQIAPPRGDQGLSEDAPAIARCDHCGQPGTAANPLCGWDWPGRPDGIWLHSRCEGPWWEDQGTPSEGPSQFEEAFERYLPSEGDSKCTGAQNAANTGTSDISKLHSPGNGCADVKCEKPNNDGLLCTCAVSKGGSGENAHVQTARVKSDDLPYAGPVVAGPEARGSLPS
jgi:hypothetical protein